MTTPDSIPTNPEDATYYCSNCGCHLDMAIVDFRPLSDLVVINGTCRNEDCAMFEQTMSPCQWMDETALLNYSPRARVQFDTHTGLVVTPLDQDIANEIVRMYQIYATDDGWRDARETLDTYLNTHTPDEPDYARMIHAFYEYARALAGLDDTSNVCDLRLAGR